MVSRSIALLIASMLLASCGATDTAGISGGPGLAKRDLTRNGDDECAFDKEFKAAVEDAGFDGEVGEYPAGFDPVILHVGDQDYADSADSTDLFDVRGAYQICRYAIGDDVIAEAYLYYFGPAADRERLKNAEAWTYAYEDVRAGDRSMFVDEADRREAAFRDEFEHANVGEPVAVDVEGHRAAVASIVARGDGASAAISVELDSYRADPDAPARTLRSLPVSGPGPSQEHVLDLTGSIARALGKR